MAMAMGENSNIKFAPAVKAETRPLAAPHAPEDSGSGVGSMTTVAVGTKGVTVGSGTRVGDGGTGVGTAVGVGVCVGGTSVAVAVGSGVDVGVGWGVEVGSIVGSGVAVGSAVGVDKGRTSSVTFISTAPPLDSTTIVPA